MYLNHNFSHYSQTPDWQPGDFIHLTGWGSSIVGKVSGIIYFLHNQLRREVTCPSPCAYMSIAWLFEMKALVTLHLEIRMFLVIFQISPHAKVKTWLIHCTCYSQTTWWDHAKTWRYRKVKASQTYYGLFNETVARESTES